MKNNIIQRPFDGCVEAINEPHQPVVIGFDVSGSMEGEPIRKLTEAWESFCKYTDLDELAKQRVDLKVITFSDNANAVHEFRPLTQIQPLSFTAGGRTEMGKCIDMAVDSFKQIFFEYNKMGVPSYKGLFLLFTDGVPTDDISKALERLKYEEGKRRINTIPIGVPGADKETLLRISKNAISVDDLDYSKMFKWISQSFVRISSSKVGEKVELPQLPDNARMIALEC